MVRTGLLLNLIKFNSFCQRKGITLDYLFRAKTYKAFGDIEKICDAEEPKGKRLSNLNILTYQICRRHEQVGNLSSLTKKSRAETKLIAFTFKTKQKVSKKLF
jgi:hypothetical protein